MNFVSVISPTAVAYIIPKATTYLSTAPGNEERRTNLNNLRKKISDCQLYIESNIGSRRWAVWSNIIFDNSWISVLVINILLSQLNKPMNSELMLKIVSAYVCFGVISWVARYTLARHLIPSSLPAVSSWVAPKMGNPV